MRFSTARVGAAAAGLAMFTSCGPSSCGPGTPTPPRVNRFVYVAAATSGERNLSWYSVTDGTGRLRPEGYLRQVARAARIDLIDSHRLILTDGDARITSYSRNLTTGRLQVLGDVRDVNHYAVSPQGDLVIATKGGGQGVALYRITDTGVDPAAVGGLPMPVAGTQLTTLFYHPTGRWVYGPKGNALTRLAIDATAVPPITQLSDAFTGGGVQDVIFERQGWRALLVFANSVVRVDVATDGSMTQRFQPVPATLSSARVHPSGHWLFAIEQGQVKARSLDTDFMPSATTMSSAGFAVGGYSWDSTGETVTITSPSRTLESYRFDVSTGAFTQSSYQYDVWAHTTIAVSGGSSYAAKTEVVALVVNKTDATIQSFKVAADGTLTLASTQPSGGSDPTALAVNPRDPFVYVAHESSGDVSAFSVDTSSGALTRVGALVSAGAQPAAIAADPSGRFVYVANAGDATISSLEVDRTTRELSQANTRSTMAARPSALAVDPRGLLLYAGSSAQSGPVVEMFSIDSSGSLRSSASVLGSAGGVVPGALALMIDPYGELLFSTYSGAAAAIGYCTLVTTLNCANGLGSEAGPLLPRTIAVDGRHGRIFALGGVANSSLFTVSPYQYLPFNTVAYPAPTPVQLPTTLSSIFTDPVQLVSSYSGDWQYVVDKSRNRIALFDVDAHNELTLRSSFATGNGPVAMAFVLTTE